MTDLPAPQGPPVEPADLDAVRTELAQLQRASTSPPAARLLALAALAAVFLGELAVVVLDWRVREYSYGVVVSAFGSAPRIITGVAVLAGLLLIGAAILIQQPLWAAGAAVLNLIATIAALTGLPSHRVIDDDKLDKFTGTGPWLAVALFAIATLLAGLAAHSSDNAERPPFV